MSGEVCKEEMCGWKKKKKEDDEKAFGIHKMLTLGRALKLWEAFILQLSGSSFFSETWGSLRMPGVDVVAPPVTGTGHCDVTGTNNTVLRSLSHGWIHIEGQCGTQKALWSVCRLSEKLSMELLLCVNVNEHWLLVSLLKYCIYCIYYNHILVIYM